MEGHRPKSWQAGEGELRLYILEDSRSNSDRPVNNMPKSTSRIFEDLMTVDEVMNSHASFHEFGISPPDSAIP